MLPTVEESRGYDFRDPDNAVKWRGLFVNSLRKVLEQVHPSLKLKDSALQYVEWLCLRLLAMMCAAPSPLTQQDVEERVIRTFPSPLDTWALADARDAATSRRRKLTLPADKLHSMLTKEVLLYKIDSSVSVFMTAVLEYVVADILKLAGNYVKQINSDSISSSDVKTAMCADNVLMDMFMGEWDGFEGLGPETDATPRPRRPSLSYAEVVRDLLTDEKHFLRDLHLIIRVFKDEIEKIVPHDTRAISLIFGNIVDIYELTVTLLGNLEDAIEMSHDSPHLHIGSCFEELAEVEEFRAYVRYANNVTRKESKDALQNIVDDPVLSERLDTAGHGFRLAVKYYLPKLLLAPIAHVFLYHHYILLLLQLATHNDEMESLKQVSCYLSPIKSSLLRALGTHKHDAAMRMATRARRQLAIEKCNELARLVENWDTRDIGQCCNEFIREDTLSKIGPGKRIAERRAFLFDGVLLLCKPTAAVSVVGVNSSVSLSVVGGGSNHQLKLKEKLHVRKLDVVDKQDTDDCRWCVELVPRDGDKVIVGCGSCAEKRNWMCDLVMLNTRPMLDRSLDSILLDLERRHPLQLPPLHLYRFAVPDSPDNIVLEDKQGPAPVPLIKGATLLKLVERLTYHVYADLNLVRTFLTTYRSFCTPTELLDLLIERFKIPEPSQVYDNPPAKPDSIENVVSTDAEKLSKNTTREDWKRYRKEFEQPVKFRVINVLRHWVDGHFYDFERDAALLQRLKEFLESVDGKPMKKWVQSVLKTIQRKSATSTEQEGGTGGVSYQFDRSAPQLLRHPADPARYDWHPLSLHHVELARQLTLLEFQLYRQVKPSELVGAVWTKKDKEKTSPNLLRIIKHTTNFTRWLEKWVVESENLEERVGVVCWMLCLGIALRELNNFNGVLCVVAAAGSAAVHRLKITHSYVPPRLLRALDEFRELNSDHFKRYQERLRSINPPCVPFVGIYLTNILHIEEGNLDFLPNSELINFSKRRKVAEITGEIQQYQNQPYCLTVEPTTRTFLESLEPFPGMDDNEITNYLYNKSLEIEPRNAGKDKLPKFPRKYPDLSTKPLKVSRRVHHDSASTNNDDTLSVSQLSPTSGSSWDTASVSSHTDGSKYEERSPRLERSGSSTFTQFSLIDKGRQLFNNNRVGAKDEPPSPRDRHSPRHERAPPLERRQALSPRSAIVEADSWTARTIPNDTQERVPPLLPRAGPSPSAPPTEDKPPALPKRTSSPTAHTPVPVVSSSKPIATPPEPPDRPLPSPKVLEHRMAGGGGPSPKRSPAPLPPSAHTPVSPHRTVGAFSFPSPSAPPLTPHQTTCAAGSSSSGGCAPPPLPPRRRRDSHTPQPQLSSSSAPPPVPPRPGAAPALHSVASSALLQRRHHSHSAVAGAPRLPPKPALARP